MAKKTPEINATSTADIAFLLLVFFLATTTMNVDSGIYRRLPPYDPSTEAPKYAERNILQVMVNRDNLLAINGELADISTLKDRTKEFIQNINNSDELPQKEIIEIPFFGKAEVSKGIISLQSDKGTSYEMYIAVQDQLTTAFNELKNAKAKEKWGKEYSALEQEQQEAINDLIPMKISEAEPKNIGGKK